MLAATARSILRDGLGFTILILESSFGWSFARALSTCSRSWLSPLWLSLPWIASLISFASAISRSRSWGNYFVQAHRSRIHRCAISSI